MIHFAQSVAINSKSSRTEPRVTGKEIESTITSILTHCLRSPLHLPESYPSAQPDSTIGPHFVTDHRSLELAAPAMTTPLHCCSLATGAADPRYWHHLVDDPVRRPFHRYLVCLPDRPWGRPLRPCRQFLRGCHDALADNDAGWTARQEELFCASPADVVRDACATPAPTTDDNDEDGQLCGEDGRRSSELGCALRRVVAPVVMSVAMSAAFILSVHDLVFALRRSVGRARR